MAANRHSSRPAPAPDVAAALARMASNMMERQMELVQDLMRCADAAELAAATSQWTGRCITGFIDDQAKVMEATVAQMGRIVTPSVQ